MLPTLITVDFETYYDREFSLSKLTTEAYVRDDLFEVIGVAVKVNDEPTQWFSGTQKETAAWLAQFDWANALVLAHNTLFDGAILSWRFGITPKGWLDTLGMGRAVDGIEVGGSLAAMAKRYGLGEKGTEVLNALGKHRADFTPGELARYGEYCVNDVELTYKLFQALSPNFKLQELKLIDLTLRMFTHPALELDLPLLEQHLADVVEKKEELMKSVVVEKSVLMSNQKLAELLSSYGVVAPMKKSPTTGKLTYAFSKSDDAFKALLEHEDPAVQAIVAARIGVKSTLEETRTQRMIEIAKRGSLPVPLRYYAAHTGRWGGDDKLNLQNLPRKSPLKRAIVAPEGYVIIDADSSQIEARTLAWLAGQNDLVQAFENGEDVYKIMASKIYRVPIEEVSEAERFVGKTTILGAGYGMGWMKFQLQLRTFGVTLDENMCRRILNTYRETYARIPALWEEAAQCLAALASPELKTFTFGKQPQAVSLLPGVGFDFPSGMVLRYNNLEISEKDSPFGAQYVYMTRRGPVRIYGGKVVENVCQALARCIIGEQMLRIAKRYRVVLTVHDAVACIAQVEEQAEAIEYVRECMRWRPDWAKTLPLNCEVKCGNSYGGAVKV